MKSNGLIYKVFAVLGFAVAIVAVLIARSSAFNGPSQSGGVGNGAIGIGSGNSISIGTSSPITGTLLTITGSTTDSSAYAMKVTDSSGNVLFSVRNDGTANVSGTLSATNLGASTVNAANVSAGPFGSSTGGGNYSFPGNVGIGTTTPTRALTVVGTNNVNISYPDGFANLTPIFEKNNGSAYPYTVPAGENLYITSMGGITNTGLGDNYPMELTLDYGTTSSTVVAAVQCVNAANNATTTVGQTDLAQPVIVGPGTTVLVTGCSYSGTYGGWSGYLVPQGVTPVFQHNNGSAYPYTVPAGENLYITSMGGITNTGLGDNYPMELTLDYGTTSSTVVAAVQCVNAANNATTTVGQTDLAQPVIVGPGTTVLVTGCSYSGTYGGWSGYLE